VTRYVAFQLITALHYVHSNGILHGDITPANVMFQPASLLSSSGGIRKHSTGEGIPRVDLLYEKKRREGNIAITLLQAPVVNYQKRSRDGVSEQSGSGSGGGGVDVGASSAGGEEGAKEAVGQDLEADLPLAEMREYLGGWVVNEVCELLGD
jgi:serine/threonine protein kinase